MSQVPTRLVRAGVDLIVTNLHRRFTGVTATTATVVRHQESRYTMLVAGRPLPGCQCSVSLGEAFRRSRHPAGRRYILWHVRRNNEMVAALFARDVLRLPVRIVFTSAAQRRHSAVPRRLISRMDAVIATTETAASFVPNVHAVVHHGVDTERFHPAKDRQTAWKRLGFPGTYGIATVGRVRPEKGTDIFVDAMIQTLPRYPEATALIIGKISPSQRRYHKDLQQQIAAVGLSQRLRFTGELPWERLPEVLRGLSLLVASPRYEGYGLTPLEAMASGVPVVATDTGHFRTFIGNQEAGILVGAPDSLSVAKAVENLVRNPAAAQQKALQARSRAQCMFGAEREEYGIHQVYEKLWKNFAVN